MGRIVIAEKNSCEAQIQKLFSLTGDKIQTGLLIGRFGEVGSQKDWVIHLASTPEDEDEDEEDESKKASASASVSWMTTHVKQVIRMLPGGLDVIGMFTVCPTSNYESLKPDILKVLTQIMKVSKRCTLNLISEQSDLEYLSLHICSKTKKIACKSINLADRSSSFKPAEWKIQQVTNQWSQIKTSCNLTLPYVMKVTENVNEAYLNLQAGLKQIGEMVLKSVVTINGEIQEGESTLVAILNSGTSGKGKKSQAVASGIFEAEIYLPFNNNSNFDKMGESQNEAFVYYSGVIDAVAYIPTKTTVKDVLTALKTDIIRSFVGRCQILNEDVLEPSNEPLLGCLLPPKRVIIHYESLICADYEFESETDNDVEVRLEEILGLTSDSKTKMELSSVERFPNEDDLSTISSPKSRPQILVSPQTEGKGTSKAAMGIIVAGLAGLLSILIGRLVLE